MAQDLVTILLIYIAYSKNLSMRHVLLILVLLVLHSSCHNRWFKLKNSEVHIATVNRNVCKKLTGKVVLYAIFVDTKYTGTWSTYDINSTLDSIQVATQWIEKQASKNAIPLDITVDYHRNRNKVVPLAGNLPGKTLSGTLFGINGTRSVDKWADKIGKLALRTFGPDSSKITQTKIKPKDRERLLARLRDEHKTDNVALIYFINNYYTEEVSVALHTSSDAEPEYAVVSFKQPGVIAHEFLHLFGALDLYISPFDNKRKAIKKKAFAMKEFPNEIMAFAHRNLDTLEIGPLSQYLIGWKSELSPEHKNFFFGKHISVASY